QGHTSGVQMQAMETGRRRWPLGEKFGRKCRNVGVCGLRAGEILARKWVQLGRDEVQALTTRSVVAPGGPGGEEVQAQAEAGLDDGKDVTPLPALRQIVAGQKDLARLLQPAAVGMVDVLIGLGPRRAVV